MNSNKLEMRASQIWREAQGVSPEDFEQLALELFKYQSVACAPYAEYLSLLGCDVAAVERLEQVPFLPIELFKSHDIYSSVQNAEVVFTSSATTGSVQSRHMMVSLQHYEDVAVKAFEERYGDLAEWEIYALLPGYLEREGSSLIYMVDRFIARSKGGGFYLRNHEEMLAEMSRSGGKKLLLGVSYALLDLAERGDFTVEDVVVMETGGMKGVREEMTKQRLHSELCKGLGVNVIASEYGMAELTSQAYSLSDGLFVAPSWMRILIRDVNDPFSYQQSGVRGGINIVDLASWHSCAFIQSQDLGIVREDGFTLEGRIDRSEIRGCNLLVG